MTGWNEDQMRTWALRDRMDRVNDVQATYQDAFRTPRGAFNKRKWVAKSQNLTRLCLLDAQARATRAADLVGDAIEAGRISGQTKEFVDEKGPEVLPSAIFAFMYDEVPKRFDEHNWGGSGIDALDQVLRMASVVEKLEAFVWTYLEDPPPEWQGLRGGSIDDDFFPSFQQALERNVAEELARPHGGQAESQ